jgi:hypothetical protein
MSMPPCLLRCAQCCKHCASLNIIQLLLQLSLQLALYRRGPGHEQLVGNHALLHLVHHTPIQLRLLHVLQLLIFNCRVPVLHLQLRGEVYQCIDLRVRPAMDVFAMKGAPRWAQETDMEGLLPPLLSVPALLMVCAS